jgi:adenylate cyclase
LAPLVLKGFHHPIAAVEIHRWQDRASDVSALRSATGGPA